MKEERKLRNKIKKVNMAMVKKLKIIRNCRNQELKGTGSKCNLYPDSNKEHCKSCPYFKKCSHYKWERDFIHSEEISKIEANRRKRKKDNQKKRIDQELLKEFEEDSDFESTESICYPFDWACPDKDKCNGVDCLYL